ncbi:MAG: hypothetical protein RLZ35_1209 [Pseudomonadota bacterium]|jgi:hypothetical protein
MLWTLIKHECRLQAISKQMWIILAGLHVAMASLFYGLIVQFEEKLQSQLISKTAHYGITEDAIHPYLAWSLLIITLLIPICNNNTLSHEQKYRTINLYQMAAVPLNKVILAKFLTGWMTWTVIIASLSILPFSLELFGHVDIGQLCSGLLGVFLIAGSVQAMMLAFSAHCNQPFYAALLTFMTLLLLSFFEWLAPYTHYADIWLKNASFLYHVKNLLNGLIHFSDILYYLGMIGFCLLIAIDATKPTNWKNTCRFSLSLIILSIILVLGNHVHFQKDVSENHLNSLQENTEQLLATIDSPLLFKLNLEKKHPYFEDIMSLLLTAQRESKWIMIEHVKETDRNSSPKVTSNYLEITYQDQKKGIDLTQSRFNEAGLYQTLYPLIHHREHWLLFTQGHGERSLYQTGPKNYTLLFALLKENGSSIASIALQEAGFIPDNTKILALTPNPHPFLPEEIHLIQDYLAKGGNLLWLIDETTNQESLSPIFSTLGIQANRDILVPNHPGLQHPSISLVTHYPDHAMTNLIENISVFPQAIALSINPDAKTTWTTTPVLKVKKQGNEIPIGMALERPYPNPLSNGDKSKTQRIMVIGNGQFLANETILNYANRELIQRVVDWLADNDTRSHLIPKPAVDDYFMFPTYSQPLYQIACPISLGLLSLAIGFWVHRRRVNKFY